MKLNKLISRQNWLTVLFVALLIYFLVLKNPIETAFLYLLEYLEYYLNYYFLYHTIKLGPSPNKNVLLVSNSTMAGGKHLMYMYPNLEKFLKPLNIKELLLITYAYPNVRDGVNTHMADNILQEVKDTFKKLGIEVHMLDTTLPPNQQKEIISAAEAIYFTGGSTFNLIKTIYDYDLLGMLKEKIQKGVPFIGVSAGTVIHAVTMKTTNDMPLAYPSSFESLNTVPFQINAHYNNVVTPGFHGETRDVRIREFLQYNRTLYNNPSLPNFVFGLKEGTAIHISGNQAELVGFGTRPGVHLQLDENDKLVKTNISVGSRIDNLMSG